MDRSKRRARGFEKAKTVVLGGIVEAQTRMERLRELASLSRDQGNLRLASRMGSAVLALEVAMDTLKAALMEIHYGERR